MLSNIDGQNLDLTNIVAQAINRLAPSSQTLFKNENFMSKIMSGIFDLVRIQNNDIVAQSLEAMISIVDSNYEFMEPYLNQLYDMTSMLMSKAGQNDDEDDKLARLSIEVWNSLCEVEILRSKSPKVPDL